MSLWSSVTSYFWPRPVVEEEAPEVRRPESLDTAPTAALAGLGPSASAAVDQQLPVVPESVGRLEELFQDPNIRVVVAPPEIVNTFAPARRALDVEFSRDFCVEILRTRDPETLGELVPNFLLHLANHPDLDSCVAEWHPRARIGRALRAGISAGRVLNGDFDKQARSLAFPFKNTIYICLRCIRSEEGWWTDSYLVYIRCIEIPEPAETGGIQPYSVSHAFPTLSEGEAFLRGARRPWPCFLRSVHDL